MNTRATLSEIALAQRVAEDQGRWAQAFLILRYLEQAGEGAWIYHCLRPGCPELLPPGYAETECFCSRACADAYRLWAVGRVPLEQLAAADSAELAEPRALELVA